MKASGPPAFKYCVKSKVNGVDERRRLPRTDDARHGKTRDGLALKRCVALATRSPEKLQRVACCTHPKEDARAVFARQRRRHR
jgi:hypothetical protein